MSDPAKQGPKRQERSEETRRRLLEAAIDVFGDQGPEASTRRLATVAQVNLAAIPYHFGSKQGLYLAAAEHIAAEMRRRLGPALAAARETMSSCKDGSPDQAQARSMLEGILEALARVMVDDVSAGFARFVIREQMAPTEAFERLYEGFIGPTFDMLVLLVAAIRNGDPEDPAIRMQAPRLIGQVLMLRAARAAVLRGLRWDDVGPREFALIRSAIRENVRALEGAGASEGEDA